MTELKPCPFCGSEKANVNMSEVGKAYWIKCIQCRADGPVAPIDIEQAKELWNTRADDWQPIETAPKDGTKIEVWVESLGCPIAVYWKKGDSPYPWKSAVGDFTWRYDTFKYWRHIRGPEE